MVLHNKGQIQLEEDGTFDIPTLKKATRVMREAEEQQEVIKLRKVPSVQPKETEKEEKPQKVSKTIVLNAEEMVQREDAMEVLLVTRKTVQPKTQQEIAEVGRRSDIVQVPETKEKGALGETWKQPKPIPKDEKPEEKITLKKGSKTPKEEEPAPSATTLKKVKKLPSEEVTPETVQLKPFEKPTLPADHVKKKDNEKPDRDAMKFQREKKIPRELENKEPPKKPEEGFGEGRETPAKVSKLKKSAEEYPEDGKAPNKIKKIPSKEPELESVKLKPISKPSKETAEPEKKTTEEKDKKPVYGLLHRHTTSEEKANELAVETKPKKTEISETSEQKIEQPKEKETPPDTKRVSPVLAVKKPDQVPEELKPLQLKKGVVHKPQEEKEEVVLKPLQDLKKKVQLKKTPSPTTVLPKEPIEALTLKKVPKKPTPEEMKVPLVKEVSPGAVQLKKVATQSEEEVFEEEFPAADEEAEQEADEAWGWELVPQESDIDWEGEREEGAVELPGMTRKGEMVVFTGRPETGNSRFSPAPNNLCHPPSWLHLKASLHLHHCIFSACFPTALCPFIFALLCHVFHHPLLIFDHVLMGYLYTFSSLSSFPFTALFIKLMFHFSEQRDNQLRRLDEAVAGG